MFENMDPEIRSKWLKRLRSAESKGAGAYCERNSYGEYSFCALGHLFQVGYESGMISRKEEDSCYVQYDNRIGAPDDETLVKFGLSQKEAAEIAYLNDSDTLKLSPSDIADIIEKKVSENAQRYE